MNEGVAALRTRTLDCRTCSGRYGFNMSTAPEKELPSTEKLALAKEAFREFHAQCFWYMRRDMSVTPADFPEIARGLRQNGGRRGFRLAEKLLCR